MFACSVRLIRDPQVGPFIDAQHPKIKIGDIDETPVEMFYRHFTDNLREFLDGSPASIVLLVPSVRDMISSHAAFPQLELGAEFAGDSVRPLLVCSGVDLTFTLH